MKLINRSKVFDILPVVIQYYLNCRVRYLPFRYYGKVDGREPILV
jgi:hypothetical protein